MDDVATENNGSDAQVPWDSLGAEEPQSEFPVEEFDPDSIATEDQPIDPEPESSPKAPAVGGGGWTFPLLCGGVALIACCAIIPQADANRRLAYEHKILQSDLQMVEKQIAVNSEFLAKVGQDPTLAERLAQRQMKVIPQGTRVLDLPQEKAEMSPFQLVALPPPAAPPAYKPLGGIIAHLCYDSHSRLYLIGLSLGMIAAGLVLGSTPNT